MSAGSPFPTGGSPVTVRIFPRRVRFAALAAFSSVVAVAAINAAPHEAHAFCGFYVAPNDAPLYADASMVALMREGTRTVLSMSNNYKGPAADFAMVVPVPVVVQKDNVKTLDKGVFQKLEKLSAPRLVEYWEQDPCGPMWGDGMGIAFGAAGGAPMAKAKAADDGEYNVKIEAQFTVGEYDIVVLSAQESDGLERWLRDNKYNIPKGASAALAPYIKEQQKFFVAKVDIKKVTMDAKGVAVLSPLRVTYETPDFRLPVRLGLLNANGKQDLIVYVLAKGKRYEVANYPNTFIPTNLDVADKTREAFGPFYATLFDAAIGKAGGKAVVTEYSWGSNSCDPCPTPPLEDSDIATLGGDVLYGMAGGAKVEGDEKGGYYGGTQTDVVLTRLHTRYDASTLGDDLVFKAGEPMVGGREFVTETGASGTPTLEKGARKDSQNNFQARYVIRHAWTGKIECDAPHRGVWGGNPNGLGKPTPTPATDLAGAPRKTVTLASHVLSGLDDPPSWDTAAGLAAQPAPANVGGAPSPADTRGGPLMNNGPVVRKDCDCGVVGGGAEGTSTGIALGVAAAMLGLTLVRRKTAVR
jgi:hypothetical protein